MRFDLLSLACLAITATADSFADLGDEYDIEWADKPIGSETLTFYVMPPWTYTRLPGGVLDLGVRS